jgi:hypothetical protein
MTLGHNYFGIEWTYAHSYARRLDTEYNPLLPILTTTLLQGSTA